MRAPGCKGLGTALAKEDCYSSVEPYAVHDNTFFVTAKYKYFTVARLGINS
jgi:hypothetical protein